MSRSRRLARQSFHSDSPPSQALIGSSRKMKPSQTGAAMYGATAGDTKNGDASMNAPAAALSRAGTAGRAGGAGTAGGATFSPACPALPAHPALATAISSAPSKIAGQIVANDHAYPKYC